VDSRVSLQDKAASNKGFLAKQIESIVVDDAKERQLMKAV